MAVGMKRLDVGSLVRLAGSLLGLGMSLLSLRCCNALLTIYGFIARIFFDHQGLKVGKDNDGLASSVVVESVLALYLIHCYISKNGIMTSMMTPMRTVVIWRISLMKSAMS